MGLANKPFEQNRRSAVPGKDLSMRVRAFGYYLEMM